MLHQGEILTVDAHAKAIISLYCSHDNALTIFLEVKLRELLSIYVIT